MSDKVEAPGRSDHPERFSGVTLSQRLSATITR